MNLPGLLAAIALAAPPGQAEGTEPRGSLLDAAAAALADFRPEAAVTILARARTEGPWRHADHVLLYEQLGIAHAYLEQTEEAREAFRVMLTLDPTRAISYTLSPKVTFLFEQARRDAAERGPPALDMSWPRDLTVDRTIPIDVEVVADPDGLLRRAELHYRLKGAPTFAARSLDLPPPGERAVRVELPPMAASSARSEAVELFLVAQDRSGNEVLLFGSERRPREIGLAYVPPDPWYGKWWVWAIAGSVVAASAGAAAFAATRDPGSTVDGVFRVER